MASIPPHTQLSGGKHGKAEKKARRPTDDWEQLELLCVWLEQREYERIRPLVLFGDRSPSGRPKQGSPKEPSTARSLPLGRRACGASSRREEGLARCEAAVWLGDGEIAVEYGGQILSRYDVSLSRDAARLEAVTNPRLFATGYWSPQRRLFGLGDALGEAGWLKALRLEGYAARARRRPAAL